MFKTNKRLVLAAAISGALAAPSAFATNGMNMEGYGPIATAMGGASMAYDNGSAAVMNNPATLGLGGDGSRFDIAIGLLQPTIETGFPAFGLSADSEADQFVMPALGWGKKEGKIAYGVGMFSQGGMGTEYEATSFMAQGTGDDVRSEVGVGRLIAPLAYNVDDKLTIGGSIDFVWAGMDLKMALTAAQAGQLTTASTIPNVPGTTHVRLDFSNDSDFSGEAKATGFGAKVGAVYKINDQFSIGGAYHSETSLSDMEGDARFSAYDVGGAGFLGAFDGEITIKDFQWPSIIALGVTYKPANNLMIAADVKQIRWADVMETFKMTFEADSGQYADLEMPQEWDNQTAVQLGVQYGINDDLVIRGGVNIADNPIPDDYVNPLFPAIVEDHYTLGLGYTINKASTIDVSLVIAPEVEVTNTLSGPGQETSHSQQNWQFMYSYRF